MGFHVAFMAITQIFLGTWVFQTNYLNLVYTMATSVNWSILVEIQLKQSLQKWVRILKKNQILLYLKDIECRGNYYMMALN